MTQTFWPFLDLFEAMQQSLQPLGVPLGVEQYDLLCRALDQGWGLIDWDGTQLVNWEKLRRVCRVLWVKPLPSYEAALKVFDQTFDLYIEAHQASLPQQQEQDFQPEPLEQRQWPVIPPRRGQNQEKVPTGEVKAAAAVQSKPSQRPVITGAGDYKFVPQDFPLTLAQVQQHWRSLRQSVREGHLYEVDVEATVARILQQGFLDDVVLRPVRRQRADLVLLVDDNAGMVPFRPAIAPLIQAITGGWVSPAQIYRFTSYPDQYLYDWQQGSRATAISVVLSRLHPSRTVMLILSDAGAAFGSVSGERIVGAQEFLERAYPCVRQLIWLNPLPRERWQGNSAQAIAESLAGQMIGLDEFDQTRLRSQHLGGVLR